MALYANVVTIVTIKNLRCICTSLHPHKTNFKKLVAPQLFPSKCSGFGWRNSTHWGSSFWNSGGIRQSWNSGRSRVTHSSHSRRTSLAPLIEPFGETGGLGGGSLIKPFLFTVAVCTTSFVGAAIWQYENIRSQMITAWSRKIGSFNNIFRRKSGIRYEINNWWHQLSEGQRCAWFIIAINTVVFMMWRHPALRPTMVKYFCSNPASKAVCWPMLLSTFSHYSLWHMMANMYVLYSFSTSIVNIFGKEHFTAFYISAGVISSFASYVHKVIQKKPSLSLGASGAIMAVLAAVCVQHPNAQLAIIFLPMLTFSAGMALKTVILLDSLGLLMGWKLFDHAAHLGGALFGVAYIKWGQDLIWRQREPFIHWWHAIRDKPEK